MISSLYLPEYTRHLDSLHTWAVIIAGIFVLIAVGLSFYLVLAHLKNYNNPKEQKWIIGVTFMVPVYSIESFISLWNPNISIECDILRNCYEAFALYSFGNYLIACLGGEEKTVEILERKRFSGPETPLLSKHVHKDALHHPFHLKISIKQWNLGHGFLGAVKFGIVQYVITKTVCAFLALLLELIGIYGDGEFRWNCGYPYITIVLNFSQMWALYCLVQFYSVTHEELKHIEPLPKFICFKAIVFATWWQGVLISLLFTAHIFPPGIVSDSVKFQSSLQNFIICIEMAIAAIAHIYVFPATPYCVSTTSHVKYAKVSLTADSSSRDPLLEIQKAEEYGSQSLRHIPQADVQPHETKLKESVQDVVLGGGEIFVEDVKITVSQAVEPVEKGFATIKEKFKQFSRETKEIKVENTENSREVKEENECI